MATMKDVGKMFKGKLNVNKATDTMLMMYDEKIAQKKRKSCRHEIFGEVGYVNKHQMNTSKKFISHFNEANSDEFSTIYGVFVATIERVHHCLKLGLLTFRPEHQCTLVDIYKLITNPEAQLPPPEVFCASSTFETKPHLRTHDGFFYHMRQTLIGTLRTFQNVHDRLLIPHQELICWYSPQFYHGLVEYLQNGMTVIKDLLTSLEHESIEVFQREIDSKQRVHLWYDPGWKRQQ